MNKLKLRFNNDSRRFWTRVIDHVKETFALKYGRDFYGIETPTGDYLIFQREDHLDCAIDELGRLQNHK